MGSQTCHVDANTALQAIYNISCILNEIDLHLESSCVSELVIALGQMPATTCSELEALWTPESDPNMVVEGTSLAEIAVLRFPQSNFQWYLGLNPKCLYDRVEMDALFQALPRRGTHPSVDQLHNVKKLISEMSAGKELMHVLIHTDTLQFIHRDILAHLQSTFADIFCTGHSCCWEQLLFGISPNRCARADCCGLLARLHFSLCEKSKVASVSSKMPLTNLQSTECAKEMSSSPSLSITTAESYAISRVRPQYIHVHGRGNPISLSQASHGLKQDVYDSSLVIQWGTPMCAVGRYGTQDVSSASTIPAESVHVVPDSPHKSLQEGLSSHYTALMHIVESMMLLVSYLTPGSSDFIYSVTIEKGFTNVCKFMEFYVGIAAKTLLETIPDEEVKCFFTQVVVRVLLYGLYSLELESMDIQQELFMDFVCGVLCSAANVLDAASCRRIRLCSVFYVHAYIRKYLEVKGTIFDTTPKQSDLDDLHIIEEIESYKLFLELLCRLPQDSNSTNALGAFLQIKCGCILCLSSMKFAASCSGKLLTQRISNYMTFMHQLVVSLREMPENLLLLTFICSHMHADVNWECRDGSGMLIEMYARTAEVHQMLRNCRLLH